MWRLCNRAAATSASGTKDSARLNRSTTDRHAARSVRTRAEIPRYLLHVQRSWSPLRALRVLPEQVVEDPTTHAPAGRG